VTPKHSLLALLFTLSCARHDHALFQLLPPSKTGVTFANTITPDDSENLQSDYFIYNGGGVAAGDINNDGLQDILLTGNMVPSKLYLNKGGMKFQDITESSGVKPDCWATGATMADVNNDGYLDIYISCTGPERTPAARRANKLYINNGNGTFTEAAARYGVADTGFTIQAVFLDFNKDGNLDLFVMNNSPHEFARGSAEIHPAGIESKATGSYDQLYRNNGDGTFTNVSREAGILEKIGYGLGVVVCDVNGDGWADLYISNDDAPNDVLYVNNRDGTFTDKAGASLKHTSFAGMGLDIADINNDGWPDIMQTDMMPADLSDRKRMSGAMNYSGLMQLRTRGFRDDYQVNALQLSNGVTPAGDVVFSEIAHLAGVAYTNWSWTALFADFDNDGRKDLFITNGYPKSGNDYDYQMAMYRIKYGGLNRQVAHQRGAELLRQLRSYHIPNYMFRNNGDLTFSDETRAWGMEQPSFSYGAAYVDLDNDGKLDLVVNNIDDPAFIYKNVAPQDSAHHWLAVQLQGDSANRNALGATLILSAGGERQYIYHSPYRGYMSTMDDRAHFGLGREARVDSLQVIWPDGRYQLLTDLAADRMVTVKQSEAAGPGVRCQESGCIFGYRAPATGHRLFQPMDSHHAPQYQHKATTLVDYDVQPLLPYMPSRQGPPLAVADVNGDSLSDVYIGGAVGVPGKLFVQQRDGSFVESARGQPWAADTAFDDWGALFFDANGHGRPDLFVASCGYRLSPVSRQLQSRLYRNVGGGRFVRDTLALPTMQTCTSAAAAGDFTGDGKPDLFVGGRLTPRNYPAPTRSYLLRNEGGRFVDVTDLWAPELDKPGGMITAAVWVDFDGDGKLDLVTAGEWMPIEFWHNDGNRLRNVTASMGLPPTRGWWYSLAVADFNHDGKPDIVAGNLGLNATYVTSPQNPLGVYAGDFSGPRSADIVLTTEDGGREVPLYGLAHYGPVIYQLALRFPTYAEFSHASMAELFGAPQLQKAIHYQADTFASLYLQNNGNGTFSAAPLPNLAQIAPIRGVIPTDVDGDGNLDLIVAGNEFDMEPNTPRVDAGNGLWLKGDGTGHFTPVPPVASGFLAPGHVTGLALVKTPAGSAVLVANNGDSLQAYTIKRHQ
jgi:hypothetical protein